VVDCYVDLDIKFLLKRLQGLC